jgi:hypothetical protein
MAEVKRTLKPMLAECIKEAVHLALIDSVLPEADPEADSFEGRNGVWTPEERRAMEQDVHAIPSAAIARMSPDALARNVAVRLLGIGGWELPTPNGPMYTGNATTAEVFQASFERPDRSQIAELAFDMGLKERDDGLFEFREPPEELDADENDEDQH